MKSSRIVSGILPVLLLATSWLPSNLVVNASASVSTMTTSDISHLSPALGRYLTPFGSRVGVSVTDVTTGESWVRDSSARFITASSIKVILMLATLDRAERTHVPLSAHQRSLMVAMIERSDNSAASYFYGLVGAGKGVAAYLARIRVTGWQVYAPVQSWWGYSTLTPNTMTTLLSRLWHGQILNATDRSYALYLMRHVVSGERFGVGDTAPAGSTVEMKNGWVVGPDGYWAVNSSGIVTVNGRTWLISVYTRHDSSYAGGVYIVRHVAGTVAAILKTR